MSLSIRFQVATLFLSTLVLFVGCTGGGGGSTPLSDSVKPPLIFGANIAVNAGNVSNFQLSGECNFIGDAQLRLTQDREDDTRSSLELDVSCEDGEFTMAAEDTNLTAFDDGEISVELVVAGVRLGSIHTLIKDIEPPVIDGLIREEDAESWNWSCIADSDCLEYRVALNTDPRYAFSDSDEFTSELMTGLPSGFSSNGDEDLYFHVQAKDDAGNFSNILRSLIPLRIDTIAPSVVFASGASNAANALYAKAGDQVTLTVVFDDLVTVGGANPQLDLSIGGVSATAEFSGTKGTPGSSHLFQLILEAGRDGRILLLGFDSGSGSIQDSNGNDLATIQAFSVRDITIDTTAPMVVFDGTASDRWTWSCTDATDCQYRFQVLASATAPESLAGPWRSGAEAMPLSGADASYIYLEAVDSAGNRSGVLNSDRSLNGPATDNTPPMITGVVVPAGNYKQGDNLVITLGFDGEVQATGAPVLNLTVGGVAAIATLTSATGTPAYFLDFRYTVAAGYMGALVLTEFTTFDASNSIADLTGNPLVADFSDWTIANVDVDTAIPTVSNVIAASNNADTQYAKVGDRVSLRLTFNERVKIIGSPDLEFQIGDGSQRVVPLSASTDYMAEHQASFSVTNDQNGAIQITGVRLNGGSISDRAENALGAVTVTATGVTVDTTNPMITISKSEDLWTWQCAGDNDGCSYRFAVTISESHSFGSGAYGATMEESLPENIDGMYYLHVQARDRAGNLAAAVAEHEVSAPRVTAVSLPTGARSIYGPESGYENLDISVTFNRAVALAGSPTLALDLAGATKNAGVQEISGNVVVFRYRIVSGDDDHDGIAVTELVQDATNYFEDGNSIKALSTVEGVDSAVESIQVDTIAPVVTVTEVAGSSWSWSCTDETICNYRYLVDTNASAESVAGNFAALVTTAIPAAGQTSYVHVQAMDEGGNTSLVATGGSLVGPAEDLNAPTIDSATASSGEYKLGQDIQITLSFNEPVRALGAPVLNLTVGGTAATAALASAVNTLGNTLEFTYAVASGQNGALVLTEFAAFDASNTIEDASNNELVADFADLSLDSNIVVDSDMPSILTAIAASDNDAPQYAKAGDTVTITVTFDDDVEITGSPELELSMGAATTTAAFTAAGSGDSHPATFIVQAGQNGAIQITGVQLNGGSIQDGATNAFVAETTSVTGVTLDTTAPAVENLAVSGQDWSWGCNEPLCSYRYQVTSTSTAPSLSGAYGAAIQAPAGSANGDYYVHVQARDVVGNESTVATSAAITVNASVPSVTRVTAASDSSFDPALAKSGDMITLTAEFSKAVTVNASSGSAAPRLQLSIGSSTGLHATFDGLLSSGSTSHSFTYTVPDGQNGTLSITGVDLNGGTIVDDSSNALSTISGSLAVTGFAVDTTAPSVTGIANDSTPASSKDWSWGCSTGETCSYRSEASADANPSGAFASASYAATTTYTENTDGTRYLHVQARDAAGNESTVESASVEIDTTAPAVENLAVSGQDWSWGCNESVCSYRYQVTSTSTAPSLSGAYGAAIQASAGSMNGDYYVHVQARDVVGNESTVATSPVITVNASVPSVTAVTAASDSSFDSALAKSGDMITLTAEFSKAVTVNPSSGSAEPRLQLSIGSSTGLHATYNDLSGFGSTSHSFTYTVLDGQNGTLSITGVDLNGGTIVDDSSNALSTMSGSLAVTGFAVDTTAPSVTGIANDSTPSFSKDWSWGCSTGETCSYRSEASADANPSATLASQSYTATTTYADSTEGTRYLHVQAIDSAGNESIVVSVSVEIDHTAPTVVNLAVSGQDWNWGCNEPVCSYRYQVTSTSTAPALSGAYGAAIQASAGSTNGDYYVHVQARDVVGNESTVATSPVITVNASVPSVTRVTAASDSSFDSALAKSGDVITLTAEFSKAVTVNPSSGSAEPRLQLSIGSSTGLHATYNDLLGFGSTSHSFTYTVLDGQNGTLSITGVDLNGGTIVDDSSNALSTMSGSLAVSGFAVDTTAPSVTGIANDSTPSSSKDWSWGCSAGETCSYRSEASADANPSATFASQSYTATTTYADSTEGTRYLHVQAIDSAGNESAVESVSVEIDTTAPTVVNLAVSGQDWNWGCNEASCTYRYQVTTSATAPVGGLTANYGSAITANAGSVDGEFYVHVQASDAAGNESAVVSSAMIAVDRTGPTVTITRVGSGTEQGTFDIAITFDEPVTGFSTSDLILNGGTVGSELSGSGSAYSVSVVPQSANEGTLTISLGANSVQDAGGNGNEASNTLSVDYDTKPPVVTVIRSSASSAAQTASWDYSCDDSDGCVYQAVVIEQSATCDASTLSSSLAWTTTSSITKNSGDGTYTVCVRARDDVANASGYTKAAAAQHALLDNTDPVITVTADANGWAWACDNSDSCDYKFMKTQSATAPTDAAFAALSWGSTTSVLVSASGTEYLYLRARDDAGNMASGQGPAITKSTQIQSVSLTATGTAVGDGTFTATVVFTSDVTVDTQGGALYVSMNFGNLVLPAPLRDGEGSTPTNTLHFDLEPTVTDYLSLVQGAAGVSISSGITIPVGSSISAGSFVIDTNTVADDSDLANAIHAIPGNADGDLDSVSIAHTAGTANGNYYLDVTFNKNVSVVGSPFLQVDVHGAIFQAAYSGDGTSASTQRFLLTFSDNYFRESVNCEAHFDFNGGRLVLDNGIRHEGFTSLFSDDLLTSTINSVIDTSPPRIISDTIILSAV